MVMSRRAHLPKSSEELLINFKPGTTGMSTSLYSDCGGPGRDVVSFNVGSEGQSLGRRSAYVVGWEEEDEPPSWFEEVERVRYQIVDDFRHLPRDARRHVVRKPAPHTHPRVSLSSSNHLPSRPPR